MIQASGVTKRFRGLDVLQGADLEAVPGRVTLLTGANGSGKSTLLKILAGLLPPDGGTASIGGMDVVQRRISSQRLLAFLPQNVTFHPASTPEGILEFYGRLRGTDKGRRNRLLAEFDLESAATRPICKLSGGMLQRLGLVLALLPDAPALILDEPGASLDPEWRIVLREELLNEARRGKTILLTSHLPEEWSDATDTWFDCREGRIFSSEPREAA